MKQAPGPRVINAELGIDWASWDAPTHLAYSQRAMLDFWPTDIISPPDQPIPLPYAETMLELEALEFVEPGSDRLMNGEQLLQRRLFNDGLLIMHRGEVIHESYRNGLQPTDRHVNHSTTKSLTSVLLGFAISDGLVDPGAAITEYLPQLANTDWHRVAVQQALDMRTGLDYVEHYDDPDCVCWSYFRATGYYPPQSDTEPGYFAWLQKHMAQLATEPGSTFNYASPVTNAIGLVAESVYGRSVAELLEEKIFRHIGAESSAWMNLDPSGVAVTEGQLSLCLRDFARWASLFLYAGKNLAGEQVAPAAYFEDITTPHEGLRSAWQQGEYAVLFPEGYYRNQTYVLNAGSSQLAMLGIHGQFALLDLDEELLLVAYGSYPNQVDGIFVEAMQRLWAGLSYAVCKPR
ncbi:MAG: serine hydrolase [Pseudomonadota bacterium]